MSSLLSQATGNSKLQLVTTAVASGAVVAAVILGYQRLQREERISRLKRSIPGPAESDGIIQQITTPGLLAPPDKEDIRNAALARRAQAGDFDDELILEQLARNRVFLGPEGLAKLRDAFVVVVGCGGVGSHCTAALTRSGVSKIRLIDFDQVTLSSLNRHAVATLADVGLPKVQVLQRRLVAVTPWVRWDLRGEKFDAEAAEKLLGAWEGDATRPPDFVVDAIDNIDTKVALLKYCYDHKLPVISAMGAGTKSDPTRVMVGDIGTGTDDRLSRATRRKLKLLGVTSGIPVVYSTEVMSEGKAKLLPLPEEEFHKGSVGDLGVLPDFRVRILPVLGTMPAVFGYVVANHVILALTGYPTDYVAVKHSTKAQDSILGHLQGSEEKVVRNFYPGDPDAALGLKVPITPGDVAFLVEELYRSKSIVTGISSRLVLMRWHKPQESPLVRIGEGKDEQKSTNTRLSHLVCLTREEATRHQKEILFGDKTHKDVYDASVIEAAERLLKEAEDYEKFR
ncbi:hypothetical protein GQ53DRAFT_755325 [Thozetella sp. PMI_491]|nr:hypothetical protein GQ53DRAFT_755325 [Thozetella sp. PMI_491]